jgi:hypothetical protein
VVDFVVRRLEQLLMEGGASPEAGECVQGCYHTDPVGVQGPKASKDMGEREAGAGGC